MKLIIIHGAPAVGKHTVAKELRDKIGYKLLHIHSVYDFLEEIFGKPRYEVSLGLLDQICLDVFEKAAQEKIEGVILTYAQLAKNKFFFIKRVVARLKKYDVDIQLVHLVCEEKELYKRVVSHGRKEFKKTKSKQELELLLKTNDYHTTYQHLNSIQIDNTRLSASEVVDRIVEIM